MTQFIRIQTRKFSFVRADIVAILFFCFLGFACSHFIETGSLPYHEKPQIDTSLGALPGYALLSLMRSLIALCISYVFAIIYGSLAASNKTLESFMIPLLDVLQSLPVIAFLPGFVIALISFFNDSRWGLEFACILTIFSGQVWNLVFAYYESKVTMKKEFIEAAKVFRLSELEKFFMIDLPNSGRPLIYNGMMSMAGGWFFLTTSEAFIIGQKDFQIPGLGSYIAESFQQGHFTSFMTALGALFLIIVGTNFFLWQPLIAWINLSYYDPNDKNGQAKSFFLKIWQEARLLPFIKNKFYFLIGKSFGLKDEAIESLSLSATLIQVLNFIYLKVDALFYLLKLKNLYFFVRKNLPWILTFFVGGAVFSSLPYLPNLGNTLLKVSHQDWLTLIKAVGITGVRVLIVLVISTLWTLPLGLWISLNPNREKFFRPIIQNLAAFPVPVLFPLIGVFLIKMEWSDNLTAIILMCNGCQWYILFNVLGGASAINGHLKTVAHVYQFSLWKKFKDVYFPSTLPSLVTGWMSAAGGAWNASMLAEIVSTPLGVIDAGGIGSELTLSAAEGNYTRLIAGVICLVFTLILINIVVWRPISSYSQKTFE